MTPGAFAFGDVGNFSDIFSELEKQGFHVQVFTSTDALFSSVSTPSKPAKSRDHAIILEFSEEVVGGFLNLDERSEWPNEGCDLKVGAAFTRFMVKEYLQKVTLTAFNKELVQKVLDSFSNIGDFKGAPFQKEPEDGHRPKKTRVKYDSAVSGVAKTCYHTHGWKNCKYI